MVKQWILIPYSIGSTPISAAKYLCTTKILFQSMGQPKALEVDKNNNE